MTAGDLDSFRTLLNDLALQCRPAFLPALHPAQRPQDWISAEVAGKIARSLRVPLANLFGVIESCAMFNRQLAAQTILRICDSPMCAAAEFTIEHAPCLGLCDRAPALLVSEAAFGHAAPEQAATICASSGEKKASLIGGDVWR